VNKFVGDNFLPMTASRLQGKIGSKTAYMPLILTEEFHLFFIRWMLRQDLSIPGMNIFLFHRRRNFKVCKQGRSQGCVFVWRCFSLVLLGHSEERHILASYFYSNCHYYDMFVMLSPLSLAKFSREELSTAVWDLYKMENWKRLKAFTGRQ